MDQDSRRTQPGIGARQMHERQQAARLRRDPASAPSEFELAWLKGAEGEAILGQRLEEGAMLMGGVAVLHDLVAPGEQANVDHVVVGPAGVTVVDAKAWSGKLWIGHSVVGQGGHGRRKPIDGMRKQLHAVSAALAAAGRDDVVVEGALCFVHDNEGLERHDLHEVDGVVMGCPSPVIRHAMRDGRHGQQDVAALVAILSAAFYVRGGASAAIPRRVGASTFEAPVRILPPAKPAPPATPRRSSAKPRRRSRRSERLGREVRWSLFCLITVFVLVKTLPGQFEEIIESMQRDARGGLAAGTLTRGQLNASSGDLRGLATRLAKGDVHGPRVLSRPDEFVLTYRKGERCLVRLRVNRNDGKSGLENVTARVRRCG